MTKPPLTILLAQPRGFCAGVERAINIVEAALQRHGRPVYVRHEIVHNRFVVESLEAKGAVFVDELADVPEGRPVVFSAHGVPKSVTQDARDRNMYYLDATCPLVSKVHHEAQHHARNGRQIILIGHEGHPEVVGTMGQVEEGRVLLVENVEQAETVTPADVGKLAYITQTTLSVDDAIAITTVLRRRFPRIMGPKNEDICYATTNRQNAVKAIAAQCDAVLVVGAHNSSNSRRLVEVAISAGCPRAALINRVTELDWKTLDGVARLGLTAGASAPEVLVQEVIDACKERFDVTLDMVTVTEETVVFNLPASLVDA
jgi:4-hydroxy-3-methylbut-2-enyl diphosphate reductase